ncbi:right-handed parallel beta-helix repeat-containing protein, partial [bacterium]|nr:right-handed parallel beta-helix repeat-containing protein [bacterium]
MKKAIAVISLGMVIGWATGACAVDEPCRKGLFDRLRAQKEDRRLMPDGMDRQNEKRLRAKRVSSSIKASFVQAQAGTKLTEHQVNLAYDRFPDNDILFLSDRGGQLDLWRMESDGSNKRQLTNTPDWDGWDASVSPSGQKIVYDSMDFSGQSHLYVMNADGTGRIELDVSVSQDGLWVNENCWSPNSQWILYGKEIGTQSEVWVAKADGTAKNKLLEKIHCCFEYTWSPDSDWIAYSYDDWQNNNYGIYKISPNGGTPVAIVTSTQGWFGGIDWSPDGSWIAYSYKGGIYKINPDSGTLVAIFTPISSGYGSMYLTWSPDGNWIAIEKSWTCSPVNNDWDDELGIYKVSPNGGTPIPIATSTTRGFYDIKWSPNSQWILYDSSDSLWVANADGTANNLLTEEGWSAFFLSDSSRVVYGNLKDIYTILPTGGNPTNLTNNPYVGINGYPIWSPDGNRIAHLTMPNSNATGIEWTDGLWSMDKNGGNKKEIATEFYTDEIAWSPDGNWITYSYSNQQNNLRGIYKVSPDGGSPIPIITSTTTSSFYNINWSPDGNWIAYDYYENGHGIYKINLNGGTPIAIVASSTGYFDGIAWSPDGSWIAYSHDNGIYKVSPNGGSPTTIITSTTGHFNNIAWSPDGSWIAYRYYDWQNNNRGIYVIPAEGGSPLIVYESDDWIGDLCWSPDSTKIAFAKEWGGDSDLSSSYYINLDGSGLTRINAPNTISSWGIDWSSQNTIAYSQNFDIYSITGLPLQYGTITGTISYSGTKTGTLKYGAFNTLIFSGSSTFSGSPMIEGSLSVTSSPGIWTYTLTGIGIGTYYVASFLDVNGNGEQNIGDPVGIYGSLSSVYSPWQVIGTATQVSVSTGETKIANFALTHEVQGTSTPQYGSVTVYNASGGFVGTYTTIQAGVNACPVDGTVSVAPGTYTEAVYINKGIALIGVGTPTITASGLGNTNTVTFDGDATNSASISGFRITGATSYYHGIYCNNGSPTITNNTISGNNWDGIECYSSSPTIFNNTISGNSYGISCWANSFPLITNNIISGNSGSGILCYFSSPSITNNTISGNSYHGIGCYDSSSPSITNNIITENGTTNASSYGIYKSSGTPTINYNCVWNNGLGGNRNYGNCSGGLGSITANPQFVSTSTGDFHLQSSSPCINAGSNTAPAIPSTDKDGNPRIVRIVDMGAYEYQGTSSNGTTYLTTNDNENNAGNGISDGDMDKWLFNYDSAHPIEFNIFVSALPAISARLTIYAYDIDETSGEVDHVFINNHFLGTLTGADNEWSTTSFNVNLNWINMGANTIRINVDVNNPPPNSDWAVTVDWGQLIIDGGIEGKAHIVSLSTDKSKYNHGETVKIIYEVDTILASQEIKIETNIYDPSMINVAGTSRIYTTYGTSTDIGTASLTLHATGDDGLYTCEVLVYDNATMYYHDGTTTTIFIDTTPPESFELLSPSDGSWTNTSPFFVWQASNDAESGIAGYELWIDGSLYATTSGTGTPAAGTPTLTHGTHTWYVVVKNNTGLSTKSSSTFTVKIDTTPPTDTPTQPTDYGTYSSSASITFAWTQGNATDTETGIAGYWLQVGTSVYGSDKFNGYVGSVTSWTIIGSHSQTYYARVKARNGAGLYGSYSASSDGITI